MRKNVFKRATAVLLSAAAIALAAPAVTASADGVQAAVLQPGQRLNPGEKLVSGESALVMQWDGNLVVRLVNDQGQFGPEVWASGTYNNWGAYAVMQSDGNFVIYRQGGGPDQGGALWSTGSWGRSDMTLSLFDGYLSVSGHEFFWSAGTGLGPAVSGNGLPRQSVVNDSRGVTPGQWIKSNSVWLVMQPDGNLVLYRKRDGAALWSTGTWNKPGQGLFVNNVDGNPYLRSMTTGVLSWSLPVKKQPGAYGKVQDDGNFVLYSASGQPLWSTGTWGNW